MSESYRNLQTFLTHTHTERETGVLTWSAFLDWAAVPDGSSHLLACAVCSSSGSRENLKATGPFSQPEKMLVKSIPLQFKSQGGEDLVSLGVVHLHYRFSVSVIWVLMFLNFANRHITCAVIQPNTFILKGNTATSGKALIFNLERSQKNVCNRNKMVF